MKKAAGLLSLVVLFCACSAQTYKVQKATAFLAVSTPGMAMQDDKGNTINPEPIIERFIYLECSYKGQPKIDSVFYNGILFTASPGDKEETSLNIGTKKDNGQPVKLTPKKGDHIWKINLQQTIGKAVQPGDVKKIIIKGKLDKVNFRYTLYEETELTTQTGINNREQKLSFHFLVSVDESIG